MNEPFMMNVNEHQIMEIISIIVVINVIVLIICYYHHINQIIIHIVINLISLCFVHC
jgi:hypothetical protein